MVETESRPNQREEARRSPGLPDGCRGRAQRYRERTRSCFLEERREGLGLHAIFGHGSAPVRLDKPGS